MLRLVAASLLALAPCAGAAHSTSAPVVVELALSGEAVVELALDVRVAEGLALAREGGFWTTDAGRRRLVRAGVDGSVLEQVGRHGMRRGEFLMPIDIVEGARRLSVLDRYGRRLVEWSRPTRSAFLPLATIPLDLRDPIAVEATPDDGLIVLDADSGRILVFDERRRLRRSMSEKGRGPCELGCPHDLALSHDETIFVADAGNRRIQRFGLDGECLGPVAWPAAAGPLQDPTGVAVDSSGRLLVADHYGHRLLRISWDEGGGVALLEDFALAPRLRYPTRLAVLPDGRVLTSSPQLSRIWLLALPSSTAASVRVREER